MKKVILIAFISIFTYGISIAQTAGDYKSNGTVDLSSSTNWQYYNGSTWVTAGSAPSNAVSGNTITILNGNTWNNQTGSLTLVSGVTLIHQGTTGTFTSGYTITVNGTYVHNTTSLSSTILGNITWGTNSNMIYRGSSSLTPAVYFEGNSFQNLSFESTSGNWGSTISGTTATSCLDFTVGSGVTLTTTFTGMLTVNGNYTVNGTITYSTGTQKITFIGFNKTVGGTGGISFENVTFNPGSAYTLNSNMTLSATFTHTVSGTLTTANLAVITSNGHLTLANSGNIIFGTGSYVSYASSGSTLEFAGTSSQTTNDVIFPATNGPSSLTINNTSSSGVTLHAPRTISGTLTLTSGILITSSTNLLTLSGTVTGSISGGSVASYVKGPLARKLAANLHGTYTYTFPVGKDYYHLFELISPYTGATTPVIQVEAFDSPSGGTKGSGMTNLFSSPYWYSTVTSGNFTYAQIRLTSSGVYSGCVIGTSATVNGTYNSIGGTITVSSPTITSDTYNTTLQYFGIGTSAAPLSGAYTVGSSSGTYTCITDAISALTSRGASGPVTFSLLDATYSETLALSTYLGASSTNTVTIKPANGVTSMITSTGNTISISGGNFYIIDGSNTLGGTTKNLSIISTSTTSAAVQFVSDACNNIVKNCDLRGACTGFTKGVIFIGSGTTSGNNYNIINNCNIHESSGGNPQFGVYALGLSAPADNKGFVIKSCNIYNFFRDDSYVDAGIYIKSGNTDFTIGGAGTGNSIYQLSTCTYTNATNHFGILVDNSSSNNINIRDNYIGGSAPNCGSSSQKWVINGSVANVFYAIYLSVSSTAASNIDGNTIKNFDFTSSPISTLDAGLFYAIKIYYGNVNIGKNSGNYIGENSSTGSINITSSFSSNINSYILGICNSNYSGQIDIRNNFMGSITVNRSGTTGTLIFDLIYIYNNLAPSNNNLNIQGNTLGGTNANSIQASTASYATNFYGEYLIAASTGPPTTISNNTMQNITNSTTGYTYGIYSSNSKSFYCDNNVLTYFTNNGSILYGMYVTYSNDNSSYTTTITNNQINNFTEGGTNSSALLMGIRLNMSGNYGSAPTTISNNQINNFTSASTNTNTDMEGIYTSCTAGTTYISGNMNGNQINNFTNNSTGTTTTVRGIWNNFYITSGFTINNNTIYTLTTASTNTDNNTLNSATGIANSASDGNSINIAGNTIYDISCTGSSAATYVSGITNFGSGSITKNKIYDLKNPNASTSGVVSGILIQGASSSGTDNIINNMISLGANVANNIYIYGILNNATATSIPCYYNTILINGTVTSGSNGSAAFYRNGASTSVAIQNNVLFNSRSGGTGTHVALNNTYGTPATGWGAGASNYNFIVCNNGSSYIGIWNGALYTFASWKANTSCDANSWNELYSNVNENSLFTAPSSGNLLINTSNQACWYVNGKGIPISTVSDDYSSNARSSSVGGGAVDIGANEFTTTTNPLGATETSGLTPAEGVTNTWKFGGRTICTILWHNGGSAVFPTVNYVWYYSGTNPGGDTTGKDYSNAYWTVNTGGTGSNYTYDVTFYYDPSIIFKISNEANIRLAKKGEAETSWTEYSFNGTGQNQYQLNNTCKTINVYGLNSFSNFTLTSSTSSLPVEIASFSFSINIRDIKLNWITAREMNNFGFDIERKNVTDINWTKIGLIKGIGNSNKPVNYSFDDKKLNTGKYNYRLKQIDINGNYMYYKLVDMVEIGVPTSYELSQNYPNPFNPVTKIDYALPFDGMVSIKVYDILGREIKKIVSENQKAGYYTSELNGMELSSGVYFYRIIVNAVNGKNFIMTKKMIQLK